MGMCLPKRHSRSASKAILGNYRDQVNFTNSLYPCMEYIKSYQELFIQTKAELLLGVD